MIERQGNRLAYVASGCIRSNERAPLPERLATLFAGIGEVVATYQRLTLQALAKKPDLLLWPETATPFYFEGGQDQDLATVREWVHGFANKPAR